MNVIRRKFYSQDRIKEVEDDPHKMLKLMSADRKVTMREIVEDLIRREWRSYTNANGGTTD